MHVTWPAYRLRRTQRVEERDAIGYDFDEMPVYDLQEEGFFFIDKKANYICMLMDDCEDLFVAGMAPRICSLPVQTVPFRTHGNLALV